MLERTQSMYPGIVAHANLDAPAATPVHGPRMSWQPYRPVKPGHAEYDAAGSAVVSNRVSNRPKIPDD